MLAVGGGPNILLWKVDGLSVRPTILGKVDLTSTASINSIALSPDNLTIAAADRDGNVLLFDTRKPDAEPSVLKEDEEPTDTPYTLTWKWSRFNEDFGKVEPPPRETVKSPYAP
jgi:hypothetical protein